MTEERLKYNAVLLHDEVYQKIRQDQIQGVSDDPLLIDLQVPCPNCLKPTDTFYEVEGEGPEVYAVKDQPPPRYVCADCADPEDPDEDNETGG